MPYSVFVGAAARPAIAGSREERYFYGLFARLAGSAACRPGARDREGKGVRGEERGQSLESAGACVAR